MTAYFSGRVQRVRYSDPESAFYIVQMLLDETNKSVSVKGNVPGLSIQDGTWFGFEANWVEDRKWGWQLSITRAPVVKDSWTTEMICNMLQANGIGPRVMADIRAWFDSVVQGEDFDTFLSDPVEIACVPGMDEIAALTVHNRWLMLKTQYKVMDFLTGIGIPSKVVTAIWKYFGDDTQSVVTKNPWALLEVPGVLFTHADGAARHLGIDDPDMRSRGAVLAVVKSMLGFGHLYMGTGSLFQGAMTLLGKVDKGKVAQAIVDLHHDGLVVIDRETVPGVKAVYDPWCYTMENESAQLLIRRHQEAKVTGEAAQEYIKGLCQVGPQTTQEALEGPDSDRLERVAWAAIREWGSQAKLQLSDDQAQGIFNALTAPVSILAGLPGTGKTTSLKAAVRILQDAQVPFLLCAPTGIAAKNLSARTGARASTIHRAFAAKGIEDDDQAERSYRGVEKVGPREISLGETTSWGYSEANPHPAQVVFIDESSMVDQHLLFRLLSCTRPDARLVFVGDYAQLPSVGPGNVLRDLIGSNLFATMKLEQIFRQSNLSGIVEAAHDMHHGKVPKVSDDFCLDEISSEEQVLHRILKVAAKYYEERRNFQILSPRHKGVVGVTNLNDRLRTLLNPAGPGKAEMKVGSLTVREDDRIMVIKNKYNADNPDLNIYNGDVGKINRIDPRKKEVEIKIFGTPDLLIRVPFDEVGSLLCLAYATTVHKSQGLEYDHIVMPLVSSFGHQLQRNLVYTAITRAKRGVLLVGEHSALAKATFNDKEDQRLTLFLERLLRYASDPQWVSEAAGKDC